MKVKCTKIGSHKMCRGCGAAEPHNSDQCEPCPIHGEIMCVNSDALLNDAEWKDLHDRKQRGLIP